MPTQTIKTAMVFLAEANQVWDIQQQKTVLGRFSWKANQPSIAQQSADAFRNDIGITSTLFPDQPCSATQTDCRKQADGGKPEISDELLKKVVLHVANQPVPARRETDDPQVLQGQKLFNQVGCIACHRSNFPSLPNPPIPICCCMIWVMGWQIAPGICCQW